MCVFDYRALYDNTATTLVGLTFTTTTIITAFTTAVTTASPGPAVCAKCRATNNSGQLSCCARGGSWFKKCGDPGDPNFDHTWLEGMQACGGQFPCDLTIILALNSDWRSTNSHVIDVRLFMQSQSHCPQIQLHRWQLLSSLAHLHPLPRPCPPPQPRSRRRHPVPQYVPCAVS